MRQEIMAGLAAGFGMIPGLVVIPALLMRTGMDFTGAYTACVLVSIAATLLFGAWLRLPLAVSCSPALTGWLAYIVILSHGSSWQAALGASFFASAGALLLATKFRGCLAEAVPGHLQELLPAAVGLMLIFLGLMQGRLLVGAPIGMVMPGNLADPVAFYALSGIVLTLALLVWKKPFAIPLGMLLTAVFSFAEGFWVLPAAPFLLPEGLDKVALQLDLEKGLAMPDVILALLVFQILTVNGMRMALRQQHGREISWIVFGAGAVGAWVGAFPPVIAQESAIAKAAGAKNGRSAWTVAAVLGGLLFCEPAMAAFASFPAITAPALAGAGYVLLRSVRHVSLEDPAKLVSGLALLLLLPLTQDFVLGIGLAVIAYGLCRLFQGRWREISPMVYVLSVVFFVTLQIR